MDAIGAAYALLAEVKSLENLDSNKVAKAIQGLEKLLRDGSKAEPSLKDLSGPTARQDLTNWTGEINSVVQALAEKIEKGKG